MAHKKQGGASRLGRDSVAKRLGVKRFGEQTVQTGDIIIRQRGNKWRPGNGVMQGSDDTLFASVPGKVKFSNKKVRKFTGSLESVRVVSVISA